MIQISLKFLELNSLYEQLNLSNYTVYGWMVYGGTRCASHWFMDIQDVVDVLVYRDGSFCIQWKLLECTLVTIRAYDGGSWYKWCTNNKQNCKVSNATETNKIHLLQNIERK